MLLEGSKNGYIKMAATSQNHTDTGYQQGIHIVILGSQGVGKTSIIEQFVFNHFLKEQCSTTKHKCYYPSIVINDHLYEVKITDCPAISYFPTSSLNEWTDFPGYGLRNATAYILVFDITNEESFQYVKSMREQIMESRDTHDIPILIVANKHDLNEERQMARREVAATVKKHWKCSYIETSAKYNWHIVTAFKEVMRIVDCGDLGHKPASARMHDVLRRNSCTIL